MKVLHVVPSVAPRYGGPSEAAIRLTSALAAAGQEVLLLTTDADGRGRLEVEAERVVEYRGAKTIFFPRLPGESLKPSPRMACWLRKNVAEFDLVHVHSVFSHASLAAGSASRRGGVPYVVRPLGQLDTWSLGQHAFRKRTFLAVGGRRLVEGAAALHWTDESESAAVPPFGWVGRGFVVPLGVDDSLFDEPPASRREETVLFLSRLHPKKNVEGLLEAFAGAGAVAAEWKLVIAGEGEDAYVRELRRKATTGAAADRVEFVGWLSGEAKLRALRSASILALPSRQENFGIAVAEAMATGMPVLVSEAVALSREVSRVGAGWVAADDANGISAALSEALASEEERARRGAAARRFAWSRFRWSLVAESLVSEYRRILGPERTAS